MAFCEQARVVSVRRLTPNMIRVSAEAIGDWRWYTNGFGDERIDLAFPLPGESVANTEFFNDPDYGKAPLGDEPPWRHYTVRAVRDGGRVIDVDFVVHDGGVASGWAERAEPGHIIGVFHGGGESRSYYSAPEEGAWQLLVVDATGLPGLGRIIEELPAGARATAIVEVPTAEDVQDFVTAGDVEYRWLVGSGGGAAPSTLLAAVEEFGMPEGDGYAWIACEAAVSRSIRSHLRRAHGMPRNRHYAVGYWTAGAVGHVEQDREAGHEHEHEHEHEHTA